MATFNLSTSAGTLRLAHNGGVAALGLIVGQGPPGPPGPGATQADLVAALAADPTPGNAAAAAVAAKIAAAAVPTAQDLGDDSAWSYVEMWGNREAAFGLRKDGTFYPTPKVETDLANKLPDLDVSTGWRWAVYYQNNEVAFGQRTDGTYYPSSLGGTTTVNVVKFGDSLTANSAPQDADLATRLGHPVVNRGIGGQTSLQIAARQGGAPARATVTGGVIPASGSVTVTLDRALRSDITTAQDVVLQGVAGTFIATNATDFLTGTFSRITAGLPVNVPAGTPIQSGFAFRDAWPIFWVGRNNFKQTDTAGRTDFPDRLVSDLKAMMAWTNHPGHALIFSIPPWVGEENGTGIRAILDAANAAIRDAFPAQYLDLAAMIRNTDIMTAVGVTPTAQDITDIGNGLTPTSFRLVGDVGHWNGTAYTAANQLIQMTYASKGWI